MQDNFEPNDDTVEDNTVENGNTNDTVNLDLNDSDFEELVKFERAGESNENQNLNNHMTTSTTNSNHNPLSNQTITNNSSLRRKITRSLPSAPYNQNTNVSSTYTDTLFDFRNTNSQSNNSNQVQQEFLGQETDYDSHQDRWIDSIQQRVKELESGAYALHSKYGQLKVSVKGATETAAVVEIKLDGFTKVVDDKLVENKEVINYIINELRNHKSNLNEINDVLNLTSQNLDSDLQELSSQIRLAVTVYQELLAKIQAEQGDKTRLNEEAQESLKQIDNLAAEYLKLKVEQALGTAESQPLRASKIATLKEQLEEITTRKRDDSSQATSRWSGWFGASKDKQAFDSVERFAKNPALSNLSKANFDVNFELLSTMVLATYALTYFNVDHNAQPAIPSNTSADTLATPVRRSPSYSLINPSSVPVPPTTTILEDANVVNKAVLLHVRQELAKVQTRADGLIGSQNPTMQFWGKVLLALALAITATVAAITLMSALGFALPTFLVPYVAYLQASALVSSVLTFVSTQLSITMAASASTTALLTAGLFGGVGYGLNKAGAPTSLKKDLDQAAKDLDAAISDTPAFRATRA